MPWFIDGAGKIEKRPSLEEYDNRRPRYEPEPDAASEILVEYGDSIRFGRSASGASLGRDLLVSLGVDGSVPLAQARVNAGLEDPLPMSVQLRRPANDNRKIAEAA